MAKEPINKSENVPEGKVAVDKEKKQRHFAYLKDWGLREWLLGIVSLAVVVAIFAVSDEIHISSSVWSRIIRGIIWGIAIMGFLQVLPLIKKTKKKDKLALLD